MLDEKIFQQIEDIGTQATKLYTEAKGTCNSPEYNMTNKSEEKIIQFLMCKIINNENLNQTKTVVKHMLKMKLEKSVKTLMLEKMEKLKT